VLARAYLHFINPKAFASINSPIGPGFRIVFNLLRPSFITSRIRDYLKRFALSLRTEFETAKFFAPRKAAHLVLILRSLGKAQCEVPLPKTEKEKIYGKRKK
jgi:hypothetical protein